MPTNRETKPTGSLGNDAEERALLTATAAGDRRAFEALYGRYHGRLAGFVRRNTQQHELIDEIINETFWVVWRNAGRFRGDSRVSTWVVGIAYRCMLKALRASTRATFRTDPYDERTADGPPWAGPSESEQRELRDWIAGGLKQLPPEQRTAIELAYIHGQSCNEIAAVMGCATGTVKAWLFRGRARLRNILPALGGETGTPRQGQR